MTGMEELIAFVRRCLDEDERAARAADSGRWLPEDKGITFEYRADDFHGGEAQARLVADTRANQWHIANWDPARVLAEVAAKRRILAHVGMVVLSPGTEALPAEYVAQMEWFLRVLAQPYAGQPGWREEWRA